MRVNCVGAIIFDEAGRLLLVKRGRPPGAGLWSLPGGRVETGESDDAAVVREIREETGLTIEVGSLIGAVDRPGAHGEVYEIRDYLAVVTGGTLRPGDDAADARWFGVAELPRLPLSTGLLDQLTAWGLLPDLGGPR